ncbi:MAG: VWA domain-containing protein [Herpetosiphonaceae bacterium]|nr:VWA domain-containing protein [Herpetosiphonaceae bacterium]
MRRPFMGLILILLLGTISVRVPAVTAQTTADTRIDVVLVIDNSGSMKQSDSHDNRFSAAKLFTDLLATNDQVGLVSLGDRDSTKTIMTLTQVTGFAQQMWDQMGVIARPKDLSEWTYMGGAIDLSATVMDSAAHHNQQRAVIFLTDGLPTYRDEDRAVQEDKMRSGLDRLKQAGVKIFPIALGAGADRNFLDQTFARPTHGLLYPAENADQLLNVYIQILARLQDGRYVDSYPVIDNTDAFLANVTPEQKIQQVNFVFPGYNGTVPTLKNLLLPDSPTSAMDKLLHPEDPNWSMWVVRPEYVPKLNGEWRMTLESNSQQNPMIAVLKSDLRARLVEPVASLPSDDQTVRYYPAGRPLLLRAGVLDPSNRFAKRVPLRITMQQPQLWDSLSPADGGSGADLSPDDGEDATEYDRPMQPGNYQLQLNISPSDSHVQLHKAYDIVVEALPTMQVQTEPAGQLQVNEPIKVHVQWALDGKPVTMPQADILMAVKRDDRVITTIPLHPDSEGTWTGEYTPPESAQYQFALTAHADWQATDRGPRHYTDYLEVNYDAHKQPLVEVSVNDTDDRVNTLNNGIQRTVAFRSYSDQPVQLHVSVAGIPGATVFPSTLEVGPHETGNRTVTVISPAALHSGAWKAHLTINGDAQVHLNATDLPISFSINGWLTRNRWVFLLVILALILTLRRVREAMGDFVSRNVELLRYGRR